jgi:hypothetical protein
MTLKKAMCLSSPPPPFRYPACFLALFRSFPFPLFGFASIPFVPGSFSLRSPIPFPSPQLSLDPLRSWVVLPPFSYPVSLPPTFPRSPSFLGPSPAVLLLHVCLNRFASIASVVRTFIVVSSFRIEGEQERNGTRPSTVQRLRQEMDRTLRAK